MIYKQNPGDRAKRDLLYYFITLNCLTALSALKTALSTKVAVFLPKNASSEPCLRHFIPPCSKYATNTYKNRYKTIKRYIMYTKHNKTYLQQKVGIIQLNINKRTDKWHKMYIQNNY